MSTHTNTHKYTYNLHSTTYIYIVCLHKYMGWYKPTIFYLLTTNTYIHIHIHIFIFILELLYTNITIIHIYAQCILTGCIYMYVVPHSPHRQQPVTRIQISQQQLYWSVTYAYPIIFISL